MYKLFFTISLVFSFTVTLYAQKSLNAYKTDTELIIDGKIDSILFVLPDSASGFILMEPKPGSSSFENTIVYVMYGKQTVYEALK